MNVVLGQRMAERVVDLGVREDRIRVIPNWADGANIVPVEPAANALRREWQLGDAFVVGYSGNLGRVHEIDTLLEAITILETQEATVTATAGPAAAAIREATPPPRVLWLFIGSGALYEALRAEATRRGLGRPDAFVSGVGEGELLYPNDYPEGRFYCRTVQIVAEKTIR